MEYVLPNRPADTVKNGEEIWLGSPKIIKHPDHIEFILWDFKTVKVNGPNANPPNCELHYIRDKLHRTDGPAISWKNGDYAHYINGNLHNDNGPASLICNEFRWSVHGKLHRTDGPAKINSSGKYWYINDKPYRENDLPNVELKNGTLKWLNSDGLLHRTTGPAIHIPGVLEVHYSDGYVHREGGPAVIAHKYVELSNPIKSDHSFEEYGTHGPFYGKNICALQANTTIWMQMGKIHRILAPAVVIEDVVKIWYNNGKVSRYDGPAKMFNSGQIEYWEEGRLSKSDGPAIQGPNDNYIWFSDGVIGSNNDCEKPAYNMNGTTIYYYYGKIHRDDDLPAITGPDYSAWYTNGHLNRKNNKPAYISADRTEWYYMGSKHRLDGPAIIGPDKMEFWAFGTFMYSQSPTD